MCTGYQVSPVTQITFFDTWLSVSCANLSQASLLSFASADKEYLHKDRDGNLFLYNAEIKEQSLYLSNSTFVICFIYFHSF